MKAHRLTRRLFVEPLEERKLLAMIAVDTTSDVADGTTSSIANLIAAPGADGKISLREAITACITTGVIRPASAEREQARGDRAGVRRIEAARSCG